MNFENYEWLDRWIQLLLFEYCHWWSYVSSFIYAFDSNKVILSSIVAFATENLMIAITQAVAQLLSWQSQSGW